MKVFIELENLRDVSVLHSLPRDGLRYEVLGLLWELVLGVFVPIDEILCILVGE